MAAKAGETTALSTTPRTSAGLRGTLFEELDSLRNGNSNPARANAVAKLADQVMGTVRLEIDIQKHMSRHPQKPKEAEQPKLNSSIDLE